MGCFRKARLVGLTGALGVSLLLLLAPTFLFYFTLPLLLVIVGAVLWRTHIANIRLQAANQTLETQLLQQAHTLEEMYQQQKSIAIDNAVNAERDRILQDIHDGLGARLLNVLLEVRTHQISPEVLALDLQACIEDLRILVSGQFVDNAPFTEVLEAFCQRADRNLRAVGIQLQQDLDWVEKTELDSETCLNILRIIQEMISNTIKHSKAQNCVVKMKRDGKILHFEVGDDGIGFDTQDVSLAMKRGTLGIQKRILRLSGVSEFNSNQSGTTLKLQLNLNNL